MINNLREHHRKCIEEALQQENVRELLEGMVCKLIKAGSKIPTFDQMLTICAELDMQTCPHLDEVEMRLFQHTSRGLSILTQLALAKERM